MSVFCSNFVFLLVYFITICGAQFIMESLLSTELSNELESAFCLDKDDGQHCNEPLGRICLNRQCKSVCSKAGLLPCNCPSSEPSCTVCCRTTVSLSPTEGAICASAEKFSIYEKGGLRWFRQNTIQSCIRSTIAGYSPLCGLRDDGKICDVFRRAGTYIEEPYICLHGVCIRPYCSMFTDKNIPNPPDCGCRDSFRDYPYCCQKSDNADCTPFQWWLRQYAANYLQAIGSLSSNRFSTVCSSLNTHGKRCGPAHICRNYQCEHVCGDNGINECICAAGSAEECQVCCMRGQRCLSSNIDPNQPIILRPVGSACNYTFGTCDTQGYCQPQLSHPASLNVRCRSTDTEERQCGPREVCVQGQCVHVCGRASRECQCRVGGMYECHVCCLSDQGTDCKSVYDGTRPFLIKPVGTLCNFTFGMCSVGGSCYPLSNGAHPSDSFCELLGNHGKLCGDNRICRNRKCEHICGSASNFCYCPPGSKDECHFCCLDMVTGQCNSVYDGVNNYLVFPVGTVCNFTYGTCDAHGKCQLLKNHPGTAFCSRPNSEQRQCSVMSVCHNSDCLHVCGDPINYCRCHPGSQDECHVCCLTPVDNVCRSIYDGKSGFLLTAPGTPCNFTYGTCDRTGNCQALTSYPARTFCEDDNNAGQVCGIESICIQNSCKHICGSPNQKCYCPPGSADECHMCCVDTISSQCRSIYDGGSNFLLKPVGTACNFTFGTCNTEGKCQVFLDYPVNSFCDSKNHDNAQCGMQSTCQERQCKHVCAKPEDICYCPSGSAGECHICCVDKVSRECNSVYTGNNSVALYPIGTPCNFTFGTCDDTGTCKALLRHPGSSFCTVFGNKDQQCGALSVCAGSRCEHICGRQEDLCLCPPTSDTECHVCCVVDGFCRTVYNGNHFLLRTIGTPCNYTFGICNANGTCEAFLHHPGLRFCQRPGNDGFICGEHRECINGECQHICGDAGECLCAPGSPTECHLCCLHESTNKTNSEMECISVYNGKSKHLRQFVGSSCNYTYGTCNNKGLCQALLVHPSQQLCDYSENRGNQCGDRHLCRDYKCEHVCGASELECRCHAESFTECHVCCLQNGLCVSVYDGTRKFLLQPVGISCDYNKGSCTEEGVCSPLTTFCNDPENSNKRCGSKHVCVDGACNHVCSNEDSECICDVSTEFECHVCCIDNSNPSNITCSSMKSMDFPWLVRPFGSPCNYTRGICAGNGFCDRPPDAEMCAASTKAWLPDVPSCDRTTGVCQLEVQFEMQSLADRLSIWVAWNAFDGIQMITLFYENGANIKYVKPTVYCDMPLTMQLEDNGLKLEKVRIDTSNPFVSIDAVQISSPIGNVACDQCATTINRIYRVPPFSDSKFKETHERIFTDEWVDSSTTYEYRVSVVSGTVLGDPSPKLTVNMRSPMCGDGVIADGEACDDANTNDHDGCSSSCTIQSKYMCSGEPSICYIFTGDGVCEDFEIKISQEDCGFYTPDGFEDHWAAFVTHSPKITDEDDLSCNPNNILGPPASTICGTAVQTDAAWRPCHGLFTANPSDLSIELAFSKPYIATSLLVYMASDGINDFSTNSKYIRIFLINTLNETQEIDGGKLKMLSCAHNPMEYSILHDLSKPLIATSRVRLQLSSATIAISGVHLRTWRSLDPVAVDRCMDRGMLYQPQSKSCAASLCTESKCPTLHVKHANIQCSGQLNGDLCSIHCSEGYYINQTSSHTSKPSRIDERNVTCISGEWSADSITCASIDCGQPNIPYAKEECPRGTTFGKTCRFFCLHPAQLEGVETGVTCGKNGVWSVPEAYCQLSCPKPTKNLKSKHVSTKLCKMHYKSLNVSINQYPVGSYCKMGCNPGFHVKGMSVRKKYYRMECNADGKWSGLNCEATRCSEPDIVYFGLYNCSNRFNSGSSCTYFCPESKVKRVSVCSFTGEWSVKEPCSLHKLTCLAPTPSRDIKMICPSKIISGATCKTRCRVSGYEAVLEHVVTTERGFNMQVLQHIPNVTCSATQTWTPDPNSLDCVKKCTNRFLGDGWCDFQNNRGYCGWDGGDCCGSTVNGGKVRLMFPLLCTSHLCQCLDPYALENRNERERAKMNNDIEPSEGSGQSDDEIVQLMEMSNFPITPGGDLIGIQLALGIPLPKNKMWMSSSKMEAGESEKIEHWFKSALTLLAKSENSYRLIREQENDHVLIKSIETISAKAKLMSARNGMMQQYESRIKASIMRAIKRQLLRIQLKS